MAWSVYFLGTRPQWSPALSAGNGFLRRTMGPTKSEPQWSPALSAGNGRRMALLSRGNAAAMEPSLIGWEWLPNRYHPYLSYRSRNGAQPYRLGMVVRLRGGVDPIPAAMEPSLIGWEWLWRHALRQAVEYSRNGAQPYRLGMATQARQQTVPTIAAMEPSLIGWEWFENYFLAGLARTCRNGAQPYRLGMDDYGGSLWSFNRWPQWSPALSAGNGSLMPCGHAATTWPQWSPALSAGNGCHARRRATASSSCRNGAQPYRLGMEPPRRRDTDRTWTPQWSPALSAGNGRSSAKPTPLGERAAMEPSLIGWEWRRKR